MRRHLVVDTSYLLELYLVPGCFEIKAAEEIKRRFGAAAKEGHRFYVPNPVLLELGNHIAQVGDGTQRKALAERLARDVASSIEEGVPWIVTPALGLVDFGRLVQDFAKQFAIRGVGLADSALIVEANDLKAKHGNTALVHLWTRDKRLKAEEPDREPTLFV